MRKFHIASLAMLLATSHNMTQPAGDQVTDEPLPSGSIGGATAGSVVEPANPEPTEPVKGFVWNPENIRLLVAQEIGADLGSVKVGQPYDIWNLKCIQQSEHVYQKAYVIHRNGSIEEIPQGIMLASYYDKIKNGAVAVEYNVVSNNKPVKTVKVYGGKTLPTIEVQTEEDLEF